MVRNLTWKFYKDKNIPIVLLEEDYFIKSQEYVRLACIMKLSEDFPNLTFDRIDFIVESNLRRLTYLFEDTRIKNISNGEIFQKLDDIFDIIIGGCIKTIIVGMKKLTIIVNTQVNQESISDRGKNISEYFDYNRFENNLLSLTSSHTGSG